MSEEKAVKEQARSLRAVSPKLYRTITTELAKYNIHSYDVQMDATAQKNGVQLVLKYGEKFNHEQVAFFTNEAVEKESEEIIEFVKETAAACEEVLKSEYFKMMRP